MMLRWSFAIACVCALVFITAPAAASRVLVKRPPYCYLPKETGPCRAKISSYYYDAYRDACLLFVYGGCYGNNNRFWSKDECENSCGPTNQKKPIIPWLNTPYNDRPEWGNDYDDSE